MSSLRTLMFGNASMGSDTAVVLADLRWVTTLAHLETLHLPENRLVDPDLSPLLTIPGLTHLAISLRRQYRKQVMDLAGDHALFAELAAKYRESEAWVATLRAH